MKQEGRSIVVFLASPAFAFAHGEQILVLPVGHAGALVVTLIVVFSLRMNVRWRIAVIAASLLTMMGTWFIPNLYFIIMDLVGTNMNMWFLVGLCPPVLIAGLTYGILRFVLGRPNSEKSGP
ncbi:MAG: hypothetical protein Q8N18_15790 [Opitutaceae bacterium]|nr:hypothetical protein [Opitutaceae bacterium]